MAEYIGCRNCDSPDCKGCNLKNLETMLNNGKFDCLMNENRCINPSEDVAPVRHGRWIDKGEYSVCTECGGRSGTQYDGVEPIPLMTQFCPNCGAYMRGEEE